ncbi:hypothetical protein BAY59_22740 [Prauserella coralliicola]|nr:hypothetical protein BAY59_22740 [Prauserella coralliicola]
MIMVTIIVILPAVLPTSPTTIDTNNLLASPSWDHLFGTDQLGRDVATRMVYGARYSLLVAFASALVALIAGSIIGAVAACGSRWIDEIIMRVTDVGLAFPGILLAIVLAAVFGPSLPTTIVVLGILFTPPMARVVRAAVIDQYGEDYVTAARVMGTGPIRLIGYHIGVNAATSVAVYTTVVMAIGVLAEAALSFLGAGIKPPTPSWGNIIADGQTVANAGAWWVSLFPGLAIVLTVLSFNRFSEALGRRLRAR